MTFSLDLTTASKLYRVPVTLNDGRLTNEYILNVYVCEPEFLDESEPEEEYVDQDDEEEDDPPDDETTWKQ